MTTPSARRSDCVPARPVHRDRHLATAQRECLQHPRQAEHVVRVEMRQEDLLEIDEPGVRAQELALRPLAAVDEQPIAAATDQRGRGAARRRRRGARRPEEDEVEIHGRRS